MLNVVLSMASELLEKIEQEKEDKRFLENFERRMDKKWFDELDDKRKLQVIELLTNKNRPV